MTIKINKPEIWISSFPIPSKADHKYLRGMVLVTAVQNLKLEPQD